MAKAVDLKFDDGFREYAINGDENKIIRFNPTDYNIKKRATEAVEKIKAMAEKYESMGVDDLTAEEVLDTETRKMINYICGSDVCSVALGNTHAMTICGSAPIYENFLNALIPLIESEVKAAQKKVSKKAKSYIDNVKDIKQ